MFGLMEILVALTVSDADAEGLRRTAPQYLTLEQAREHTMAARVGGLMYNVDPDLLLATAITESNYEQRVTYVERTGTLSCGVMQANAMYDRARCDELNDSLLEGYIGGAKHLRRCMDDPTCGGNLYCGLSYYAGGVTFIRNCRDNPELYRKECSIPGNRLWRAKWIREQRKKAANS